MSVKTFEIDPELEDTLRCIITTKVLKEEWSSLVPKLINRLNQILNSYYKEALETATTTDHIVNINTNVKEPRPDEMSIMQMVSMLGELINERFDKYPPFTIVRISELLLFDSAIGEDTVTAKELYGNSPMKFLRALWLAFNVVTRLDDRNESLQPKNGSANDIDNNHIDNSNSSNKEIDPTIRLLPIQSERGGETKTIVMTKISWLNDVNNEEDEDEEDDRDYVAGEEDEESGSGGSGSGSSSDATDNDDQEEFQPLSQPLSSNELHESDESAQLATAIPVNTETIIDKEVQQPLRNPQLDKFRQQQDVSAQQAQAQSYSQDPNTSSPSATTSTASPKTRKEQLDSPNIKRRKSDVSLTPTNNGGSADTSLNDVSMHSAGDDDDEEEAGDISKEDIKMKDDNLVPSADILEK